jgi:hypothetical protein
VSAAVVYDYFLGWPENVADGVRRSYGQHCRRIGFHSKVGITNDPFRRWREAYQRAGWRKMVVIYMSSSHKHVCQLERMMVDRLSDELSVSTGYYYNSTGGGGGRRPARGPYFLYFVLAPKYARII